MIEMIELENAEELVKEEVTNEKLRKHMYAVSQIMKNLAKELDKNEKLWQLTGLLHDIDYEQTKDNPETHGEKSAEILNEKLPSKSLEAIKAHNFQHLNTHPDKDLDKALIAADAISGLIIATALVMPNSKLEEVRVESVEKKFEDSSFAKSIDRERILYYKKLGLDKKKFIEISLNSLKEINEKLDL